MSGRHSDCCPRYIDTSVAVERFASDDENDLETSRIGASPKRRCIQPLHFPGQISVSGDGKEIDHIEMGSQEGLHLFAEDDSIRFDGNLNADSTLGRNRALSAAGSYGHSATRSVRSRHEM
jgi:hypothetical protein